MDPDDLKKWPSLVNQMANSDELGIWAAVAFVALIAVLVIRIVVKDWRQKLWMRRLFWVANLLILPAVVFASVHIIGVTFNASTNAGLALWLERGGDASLAIVFAILLVEGLDIVVWKGFAQKKFGQITPKILVGVSAFIVYLATAYIIAAVIFDIPVTGALVSSGIVLGVIGLSLQNTISDIFSGIFISLERPFSIGDWIVTEDGRLGQVIEIDWRATRLLSFNQTVFVVPNSKIANSIIENRAEPSSVYGHYFYVHMSPEAPVGLVRRVLLEAVLSSPYVQSEPPPNVYLSKGNQRPYQYLVYVYFESYEASWRGNGDVQTRIHHYLKRAGLTVAGEAREIRHQRMAGTEADEPTIQQLLSEIRLFESLSIEELELLSESVRTTRYRSREIVINEGDPGDSLLVITSGLVNVTRKKPRGKDESVSRLGMGQCIGEMSLLTGRTRSATVRAVTDCEVVEIPKEGMNQLLEKHPELIDKLAVTMTARRSADELISDRDLEHASRMTLQDIADKFGSRIRSFFRH